MCCGCLTLPNTACWQKEQHFTLFHPGTDPGVTSDSQVLSLSAFQPDTYQVFPGDEAWQLQDLRGSSWLEHLRAGTDRDFPEFRDPVARDTHNGFEIWLQTDLAPSSWTCSTYGCFNRGLFSLLHCCVNFFGITSFPHIL